MAERTILPLRYLTGSLDAAPLPPFPAPGPPPLGEQGHPPEAFELQAGSGSCVSLPLVTEIVEELEPPPLDELLLWEVELDEMLVEELSDPPDVELDAVLVEELNDPPDVELELLEDVGGGGLGLGLGAKN